MICFYLYTFVQIVLESLPVSSSGHLKLLTFLYPLPEPAPATLRAFDFFLHLPTAGIIMLFFAKAWLVPLLHLRRTAWVLLKIISYTGLTTLITLSAYMFKSKIAIYGLPLASGFFVTFAALASLWFCREQGYKRVVVTTFLWLGFLQSVALLVPGVSRFALTFVGARWAGIRPQRALELSFLIEWPLILAAGLYGSFILITERSELLNPLFAFVMLGSSCIGYSALFWQADLAKKHMIKYWALYIMVPLIITVWLGV